MSRIRQLGWVAALAAAVFAADPRAKGQEPQPPVNIDFEEVVAAARNAGPHRGPGNNFRDFNEVTREAEKIEGLFTLIQDGRPPLRRDQAPSVRAADAGAGDHRPRHGPGGQPVGDDDGC